MNVRRSAQSKQKPGEPLAAGFTIVEILIVLAIAGVILLLVFLAIPQLERVSRNGQRKQDVAAILTAVSHYELSNSGNFPPVATPPPPVTPPNINIQDLLQYTQLTYYNASQVTVVAQTPGMPTTFPTITSPDQVYVTNYAACNGGTATSSGADYRSVVALYALETAGSGVTQQCQQL